MALAMAKGGGMLCVSEGWCVRGEAGEAEEAEEAEKASLFAKDAEE